MAVHSPIAHPFVEPVHDLGRSISRLGEIVELPVNVPHYATCHTSVVTTGKKGITPGELYSPHGVVIHDKTHEIFVANQWNDRVKIFSETGEFLSRLREYLNSVIR